ncbi:undecaprenyl-diphosphate phosphatase [Candidatus Parcubacteria bacterium]|nr:undecaprenyl-diphosphate phosphatase [Candidatus Parcubacteria bacterium]
MTVIQTIILGIIEGITEFLPVSSTGHLILVSKFLNIPDSDFLKSFEIAIQSGAILAVVVLYWKKIWSGKDNWKKVLVAFLPTAVIGFVLYKVLKTYLLGNEMLVIWTLALGGVALIAFELWHKKYGKAGVAEVSQITYKKSFLTGIWQSIAIIPGVSRSGATIVGGLLMGISREAIVEFSFLLAVPTMAAATGYDLLKSAASFTPSEVPLLILGFLVSFGVAIFAVKWFIAYVQKHSFIAFGVYRIVIALVFYIYTIAFPW